MTVSDPYQSPPSGGFHAQPQGAPSPSAQIPYQVPVQQHQQTVQIVAAKSPGVAALLSLLWFGAGHLYAGSTGIGITLIVFDFFLALCMLVPLLWLIIIPLWFVLLPIVMITAASSAKGFNQRNGIIVR